MSYVTPARRHSPQVYRIRRAILATVVVLVVALGWQLVAGGDEDAAPPPTSTTTSTTIPELPACVDDPAQDIVTGMDPKQQWPTIRVDTQMMLPASYGPPDLHNISDAGFPFTDGLALRGFVMDDLSELREDAAENGTPIKILAAYRSYQSQEDLFARRVDELGASEAGSRVARPGHSEHQLGTTIDITSEGLADVDQSWGASPAGQWIASHAHEYGFLLSYPSEASASTCYDFEPWHLRYVGRDHAAVVIAQRLTLREYLWNLEQGVTYPPPTSTTTTTTVAAP
jgi:D-alanyl-D-alanine carboxypeptidase